MREQDLALARKQVSGLQDDNDRMNRMYLLLQKETFTDLDKLKAKGKAFNDPSANDLPVNQKKGYQPLR